MRKILLILMILCTHALADNNCNRVNVSKEYEIIETIMRIRVKYPPTHKGTLILWNDYLNK
jgi:hypothetical protein